MFADSIESECEDRSNEDSVSQS